MESIVRVLMAVILLILYIPIGILFALGILFGISVLLLLMSADLKDRANNLWTGKTKTSLSRKSIALKVLACLLFAVILAVLFQIAPVI